MHVAKQAAAASRSAQAERDAAAQAEHDKAVAPEQAVGRQLWPTGLEAAQSELASMCDAALGEATTMREGYTAQLVEKRSSSANVDRFARVEH